MGEAGQVVVYIITFYFVIYLTFYMYSIQYMGNGHGHISVCVGV